MLQERLLTEKGKSYWDSNGAYQKEYDELYDKLVPPQGDSETIHGELIRCASRFFYEYCNNGNCNAVDIETVYETESEECSECYGSGEADTSDDIHLDSDEVIPCMSCDGSGEHYYEETYDGDKFITEYYSEMIGFLSNNLIENELVDDLVSFMGDKSVGYGRYSFSDDEMGVYNRLVDSVMFQVLTTDNKRI